MKQLKVLIVEDDFYNQKAVEAILVNHFQEIKVVGKAKTVEEGLKAIEAHQPDLLILDIHLPDGTSFDLLQQCDYQNFKVVFMSAYHEYALEALRFAAVEFVFKPFDVNEMVVAVDKAIDEINDTNYPLKIQALFDNIEFGNTRRKVVLQGRDSIRVCDISEIVWAEAIIGGAVFHFEDGTQFHVNTPLRRYEAILNTHAFFRCHPHYLINLLKISDVNVDRPCVTMSDNSDVELELRRYKQLISAIQQSA